MSDEPTFPTHPSPSHEVFGWESQSGIARHLWSCYHRHDFVYRTTQALKGQDACQNCQHTYDWYINHPGASFCTLPAIFEREGGAKGAEMVGFALEVVEAVIRDRVALEVWGAKVVEWRKAMNTRVPVDA